MKNAELLEVIELVNHTVETMTYAVEWGVLSPQIARELIDATAAAILLSYVA